MAMVKRLEVYLVTLDRTVGSEIRKTRPAVVVSPDEMNRHIGTVIVAPMSTKGRPYPSRVRCQFRGKERPSCAGSAARGRQVAPGSKAGSRRCANGGCSGAVLCEMFAR